MTIARVSQVVAEVLRDGAPKARVSQVVAEVLRDGAPKARVSQVVAEVLYPSDAYAPYPSTQIAAWMKAGEVGPTSAGKSTTLPTSHAWAFLLVSIPSA